MRNVPKHSPPACGAVIICDVGPDLGVGHLMRCLALAEELVARGVAVTFSADAGSVPFAVARLAAAGIPYVDPPNGTAGYLAQLAELDPAYVVIDSYHLPAELYAGIRRTGRRTLAIVDGDPSGREADLYVDQNIGAEQEHWPLPDGSRRLAGLRYCLMRDEVRRQRPADPEPEPHDGVPWVLAFFGGTDAYGAAPVLARALIRTGRPLSLTVVAARDDVREELEGLAPADGQSIEVIAPTDRLPVLVRRSDLVVSAAGSSSWELFCLGAAVGFVCVADNQRDSYRRVAALGLSGTVGVLDELRGDLSPAVAELDRLLGDARERARIRRAGWELVDGEGRVRVADELLSGAVYRDT